VKQGGGGAIRRAYDSGQSHHALRAWNVSQDSAGSKSKLFGIMTTISDLPKKLQGRSPERGDKSFLVVFIEKSQNSF